MEDALKSRMLELIINYHTIKYIELEVAEFSIFFWIVSHYSVSILLFLSHFILNTCISYVTAISHHSRKSSPSVANRILYMSFSYVCDEFK